MRIFLIILTIIFLLVASAFGLVFSSVGNGILQPIIESNLNESIPVRTKVETFVVRLNRLDVAIRLDDGSVAAIKGTYGFSGAVDMNYSVNIIELANLQALTEQRYNGPFSTSGTIRGDAQQINIDGISDVAKSDTQYHMQIVNSKPARFTGKIAGLQIDALLEMLNKPRYASGSLFVDADIKGFKPGALDGAVLTVLKNGVTHPVPLKRDFNLSADAIPFNAKIDTQLKGYDADSVVDFRSAVADLHCDQALFDTGSSRFTTDYRLSIPDLDKLYFATGQHMKGGIVITGDVLHEGEKIKATAHSDTLGGTFDATFEDGTLDTAIKSIRVVALTDMLVRPRIFDSRADVTLHYDTLGKQGTLKAELLEGKLLPNKFSRLINQMASFDITKEVYKFTRLSSTIKGKKIVSDLHMDSRLTEIVTKQAVTDLDAKTINARVDVKVVKTTIPLDVTGSLDDPDIGVDMKAFTAGNAAGMVEQGMEKLPDEIKKSPVGEMMKSLF